MSRLTSIIAARRAKWRGFKKLNNGGQLTWPVTLEAEPEAIEAREQDIEERTETHSRSFWASSKKKGKH